MLWVMGYERGMGYLAVTKVVTAKITKNKVIKLRADMSTSFFSNASTDNRQYTRFLTGNEKVLSGFACGSGFRVRKGPFKLGTYELNDFCSESILFWLLSSAEAFSGLWYQRAQAQPGAHRIYFLSCTTIQAPSSTSLCLPVKPTQKMVARPSVLLGLLQLVSCLVISLTAQAESPKYYPFRTLEEQDCFYKWKSKQLRENIQKHGAWINFHKKGTCPGMKQNQLYFRYKGIKEMQTLSLVKSDNSYIGSYNEGIYDVIRSFTLEGKRYRAGGYIIKLVDITSERGKMFASCKPHALEQVDIWHRTGILTNDRGVEFGAILMKRELGEELGRKSVWRRAGKKKKLQILNLVKEENRNQLHRYAFETPTNVDHILHADNNPGNLPIQFSQVPPVVKMAMIDWGHPGLWTWYGEPKAIDDPQFTDWHEQQFSLDYALEYYDAGDTSVVDRFWASDEGAPYARKRSIGPA
ncbi:hypothetical protein F5880DRAFT_1512067 [Lentinula raphanica]|nr:hypothetical protein F5880DRAFT_1512067 [Lentinula raphanica]